LVATVVAASSLLTLTARTLLSGQYMLSLEQLLALMGQLAWRRRRLTL
jgi:hypothetical protein